MLNQWTRYACMIVLTLASSGCRDAPASKAESKGDTAVKGEIARNEVPTRIIALAPNAAEIICALGACTRLVGVSDYCKYPPEIEEIPKIGGLRDPDLELVTTLRPDLVILRGKTGPLRKYCDRFGVPVYDDQLDSLDDIYRTIKNLGNILDLNKSANKMSDQIRADLASVEQAVKGLDRPKVLLTIRNAATLSDVFTVGGHTFLNSLISIAGGENIYGPATELYPGVPLEEIVLRDPDVIIEAMAGEVVDEEAVKEQWKKFSTVSAVKNGRIYVLTEGYLTIPSQRVTWTARDLARVIHPDVELPAIHGMPSRGGQKR